MELRQHLSVLRSRIWLVLVATVLVTAVGYTTSSGTSGYVARSTLYLGSRAISLEPGAGDLSNDRLAALDRVSLTFSKMIASEPVAERALRLVDVDLSPSALVRATDARPEPATQLLYIEVLHEDPPTAQVLSNALADAFVEAVQELEPVATEGAVPRLPVYIFERAALPSEPEPTDQLRTTLLAVLFGLVAGAALVFLLDHLDVSVRTPADAERHLDLPVLGAVPRPTGAVRDEAFRVLRTNLLAATAGVDSPVVAVTSALPGEGKTSTAVALARSLAQGGTRVALVDLDLRSPGAHRLLGAVGEPGCTDVLRGRQPLDACVQVLAPEDGPSSAVELRFLASGRAEPNPTELLGDPSLAGLLGQLAAISDLVLLDAPPVLPVADALVIGRLAAGALLVVESGSTPVEAAHRAATALQRTDVPVLGVVLDRLRASDDALACDLGYGPDHTAP